MISQCSKFGKLETVHLIRIAFSYREPLYFDCVIASMLCTFVWELYENINSISVLLGNQFQIEISKDNLHTYFIHRCAVTSYTSVLYVYDEI